MKTLGIVWSFGVQVPVRVGVGVGVGMGMRQLGVWCENCVSVPSPIQRGSHGRERAPLGSQHPVLRRMCVGIQQRVQQPPREQA